MKKLIVYLSFEKDTVDGQYKLTLWDNPGKGRVKAHGVVDNAGEVTLHSDGPVPRHAELPIFQLG